MSVLKVAHRGCAGTGVRGRPHRITVDRASGNVDAKTGFGRMLTPRFTNASFNRLATETWNPWGPSINIEMNYYAAANM